MKQQSEQTRLSSKQRERLIGHRVLVPPRESPEQAQGLAENLNRNGFNDLLVYRSGEFRNGISLGVFAERSNAERLSARAHGLGIDTRLVPVVRPWESHFVFVRRASPDGIDLTPVLNDLKMATIPTQPVDCHVAELDG